MRHHGFFHDSSRFLSLSNRDFIFQLIASRSWALAWRDRAALAVVILVCLGLCFFQVATNKLRVTSQVDDCIDCDHIYV